MLLDSAGNIIGQPNEKFSFAILNDVNTISLPACGTRKLVAGAGFEPAVPRLRDYELSRLRPVIREKPLPPFCRFKRFSSVRASLKDIG